MKTILSKIVLISMILLTWTLLGVPGTSAAILPLYNGLNGTIKVPGSTITSFDQGGFHVELLPRSRVGATSTSFYFSSGGYAYGSTGNSSEVHVTRIGGGTFTYESIQHWAFQGSQNATFVIEGYAGPVMVGQESYSLATPSPVDWSSGSKYQVATPGGLSGKPVDKLVLLPNFTYPPTNQTGFANLTLTPALTPPTITTVSPLPTGAVGVSYSQSLSATGGATPYVWSISSGSLPSGLSLIAGVITGTPDTAGTASFIARVTGDDGASSTLDLSLTIQPASADLAGLELSNGTLTPAFNLAETNYATITNVPEVSVTPTTGDTGAVIAVRCNSGGWLPAVSGVPVDGLLLQGGSNTVEIRVTAAGGTPVKIYTVTITRELPLIAVSADTGPLVDDDVTPLDFGSATPNRGITRTLTITNVGVTDLILETISKDGTHANDFTVTEPLGYAVSPGAGTTFTVTFTPSAANVRTATIRLASNVSGPENPFDINVTGTGLDYTTDTDGDGMNDGAEFDLSALGFDWQSGQPALVDAYYAGANSAGLYTAEQFQALRVGAPLLERDSVSGWFKLTLGIAKATDLTNFTPFPMTAPQVTVSADGELELNFRSNEGAAFFRVEAR